MFNQIISVDAINLSGEAIDEIKKLSKQSPRFYDTDPKSVDEIKKRIGDADCVLVSWRTKLGKDIFEKCQTIKYVGYAAQVLQILTSRKQEIERW